MFCKNCGKKSIGSEKFCTSCGTAFNVVNQNKENSQGQPTSNSVTNVLGKINIKNAVWIIIVLAIVGYNIYSSRDQSAIETNNNALSSFDSGNNTQAISQLQDASNGASTNETKLTTLVNLAYVQETDGKNDEALGTFQKALALTSQNSFDYYLISAEIALLQNNPNSAYINFNKALKIEPDNYQVNNSLAIFYMNLDGSSADYEDYSKALTYALKANTLSNSTISKENLGIAYFWNDQYDQSISLLSPISITQHPYIGFWLGYDYAAKKDVTNAKYYFNQAINAGGTPPKEVTDYLNSH